MSFGSLENVVRNRVRMLLRRTWVVAVIGALVLGGVVSAAFYYSTESDRMRIAAGP